MSIKEAITQELLDCADDPSGLEKVYERYGRSKGPFYLGLAAATTSLGSQLETLVQEKQAAQQKLEQMQAQVQTLEESRNALDQSTQALGNELDQKEARLPQVQRLIDAADTLQEQGFGEHELKRLFDILAVVATSQGERAVNGVEMFFDVVEQWGDIVSLELQAQRSQVRAEKAQAQAQRWEADAKRQEAKTKARATSIGIVEQLLNASIKADDLPAWQAILAKAGISPDELAASLEQFGSVERLTKVRQNRANELQRETRKLHSQVNALTQERESIQTAIQAVYSTGVKQVEQAGQAIIRSIQGAGEEARQLFGSVTDLLTLKAQLEEETSTMQGEIQAARAFRDNNPQFWQAVPTDVIRRLLQGIMVSTMGNQKDVDIKIPKSISKASSIPRFAQLRFSQILLWAFYGFATPEERKALYGGR